MNKDADFVDVFCDATIALPLIYSSVKDKKDKKDKKDREQIGEILNRYRTYLNYVY